MSMKLLNRPIVPGDVVMELPEEGSVLVGQGVNQVRSWGMTHGKMWPGKAETSAKQAFVYVVILRLCGRKPFLLFSITHPRINRTETTS